MELRTTSIHTYHQYLVGTGRALYWEHPVKTEGSCDLRSRWPNISHAGVLLASHTSLTFLCAELLSISHTYVRSREALSHIGEKEILFLTYSYYIEARRR